MTDFLIPPSTDRSLLGILKKARAFVSGDVQNVRWGQGSWLEALEPGQYAVCLLGAIDTAFAGATKDPWTNEPSICDIIPEGNDIWNKAYDVVYESVVAVTGRSQSAMLWNDHYDRTQAEVVVVLDHAIQSLTP